MVGLTEQIDAQERMLSDQLVARGITSERVLDAMRRIPRQLFLAPDLAYDADAAFRDSALPIGCGQTLSQPFMVGLMTQSLEIGEHDWVLDVGTGSGYQAAVLSRLARQVVSIERHPALSQSARRVIHSLGIDNVRFVVGDGVEGCPAYAPFDCILVAAGAQHWPHPLLDQLADGGRMVIPIGPPHGQYLQLIRKRSLRFEVQSLTPCRFVPLVGAQNS